MIRTTVIRMAAGIGSLGVMAGLVLLSEWIFADPGFIFLCLLVLVLIYLIGMVVTEGFQLYAPERKDNDGSCNQHERPGGQDGTEEASEPPV